MTIQEYIEIYIETINKRSKEFLPMQPGDVPDTYADVDQLIKDVNYRPETRFRMASSGLLRGTGSITGLMGEDDGGNRPFSKC